LLARREHSRLELARKLRRHCEDADEIAAVLDEFERRGWLSEARFVEQTVAARRARFGAAFIAHELAEKGVSRTATAEAAAALKGGDLEAARAIWRRRFGQRPADARERARQTRFLAGRGFTGEVIRAVLGGADDD
jgi:regulatory protein